MLSYLVRRLTLLPLTLFCIILVNFVIINLAPGEPTTVTEISHEGLATRREEKAIAFGVDNRYLQFREHYGLTLPIIINLWPFTSQASVGETLRQLTYRRYSPGAVKKMPFKDYKALRIRFGDRAKFIMPHLLQVIQNPAAKPDVRRMAIRFFVRGGTHQAYLGADLSAEQRKFNQKISEDNQFLLAFLTPKQRSLSQQASALSEWYQANKEFYHFDPSIGYKLAQLFETRLFRYLQRVLTLDFGTLRNDPTKRVITEVAKRFKYSLTLAFLPMVMSFFLSQAFGSVMAYTHNKWQDVLLNVIFLVLYAIPVFVVAPFLIEKIALSYDIPFTNVPFPISGFTSKESVYENMTSMERLFDVMRHVFLPLIAIMYGTLAASARLSRTAILEVLRQDYVRTARAKGVSELAVLIKHVGRNASITIITALASSLGIVLGGSLIVETLFEINGFGKFFYDAVINRDYNVIMFSSLAGAFLSLVGYLAADIAYMLLDPRVTLE